MITLRRQLKAIILEWTFEASLAVSMILAAALSAIINSAPSPLISQAISPSAAGMWSVASVLSGILLLTALVRDDLGGAAIGLVACGALIAAYVAIAMNVHITHLTTLGVSLETVVAFTAITRGIYLWAIRGRFREATRREGDQ